MPQLAQAVLEPRKSPVQARSAASVDVILEATIQVLLIIEKAKTRSLQCCGAQPAVLWCAGRSRDDLLIEVERTLRPRS